MVHDSPLEQLVIFLQRWQIMSPLGGCNCLHFKQLICLFCPPGHLMHWSIRNARSNPSYCSLVAQSIMAQCLSQMPGNCSCRSKPCVVRDRLWRQGECEGSVWFPEVGYS